MLRPFLVFLSKLTKAGQFADLQSHPWLARPFLQCCNWKGSSVIITTSFKPYLETNIVSKPRSWIHLVLSFSLFVAVVVFLVLPVTTIASFSLGPPVT